MDMARSSRVRRLLGALVAIALVVLAVLGFVFEPWALWTDKTVNEPLPSAQPATASLEPSDVRPSREQAPAPKVLARGDLISHEHETAGRVLILELSDSSRVLRLEDLDTSNGPDVEVWITDAPVIEGSAGWHLFDDGEYVELGDLKGNHGNQNYELPESVDLAEMRSVSLWCDRFNVSFGAALLT